MEKNVGLAGSFLFRDGFPWRCDGGAVLRATDWLAEGWRFFRLQKGGEPVLPEMMGAFDFTFGLGRGRVTQRDFIELPGAAQLGERFVGVGEEKL